MSVGVLQAAMLAEMAHHGQVDKAGDPYYSHVWRVAAEARILYLKRWAPDKLITPDWQRVVDVIGMVGYLHDVVEDTEHVTLMTLKDLHFDRNVVRGVASVTRADEETYAEFIRRAAAHPIGRWVKLADVEDHLRPGFVLRAALTARYEDARMVLREAVAQ